MMDTFIWKVDNDIVYDPRLCLSCSLWSNIGHDMGSINRPLSIWPYYFWWSTWMAKESKEEQEKCFLNIVILVIVEHYLQGNIGLHLLPSNNTFYLVMCSSWSCECEHSKMIEKWNNQMLSSKRIIISSIWL